MVVDEAIDVVPCFSAALVQQTKLRKDLGNCDTAVIRRTVCTEPRRQIVFEKWSGARDLNPGPHGPEPSPCHVLECPGGSSWGRLNSRGGAIVSFCDLSEPSVSGNA